MNLLNSTGRIFFRLQSSLILLEQLIGLRRLLALRMHPVKTAYQIVMDPLVASGPGENLASFVEAAAFDRDFGPWQGCFYVEQTQVFAADADHIMILQPRQKRTLPTLQGGIDAVVRLPEFLVANWSASVCLGKPGT